MSQLFVQTYKINDYSDVTILFGLSLKHLNKNMTQLYSLLKDSKVFCLTLHSSNEEMCSDFQKIDNTLDIDDFYILICKGDKVNDLKNMNLCYYKNAEHNLETRKILQSMFAVFLKNIKKNSILSQM